MKITHKAQAKRNIFRPRASGTRKDKAHKILYAPPKRYGLDYGAVPQFRKDPFGPTWVIISPERGLQASDFGSAAPEKRALPALPRRELGRGGARAPAEHLGAGRARLARAGAALRGGGRPLFGGARF